MIKVVNPFNKNMDEVYTAANSCECHCSVNLSFTMADTRSLGGTDRPCNCVYGTANRNANYNL